MPFYTMPGGGAVHINFGRDKYGRSRGPAPCVGCGWISTRLCDWKVADVHGFKNGGTITCDRPVCDACTWSPEPDKDLCPACVQQYRRWLLAQYIPVP